MKKIIIITAVLFIFANIAATDARLLNLGTPFWAQKDNTEVFAFPSMGLDLANTFVGENLVNGFFGGLHFRFLDNIVIGAYFNRAPDSLITRLWDEPGAYDTQGIYSGDPGIDRLFDIFMALDMGDIDLGLLITFSNELYYEEITDENVPLQNADYNSIEENKVSDLNFTFDISLSDFAPFDLMAFAVDFGILSHSYKYLDQTYNLGLTDWENYETHVESDGALEMTFRLLTAVDTWRFYASFTFAGLDHVNDYMEDDDADGAWDYEFQSVTDQNWTDMTFGFSKQCELNNFTLFLGAYFRMTSWKWNTIDTDITDSFTDEEYNYKEKMVELPIFIGAEFRLKKWLNLYAGFNTKLFQTWYVDVNDPDWIGGSVDDDYTEDVKYCDDFPSSIYLGTRFIFSKFMIDIVVYPEDLLEVYILSGDDADPLAKVAIIYFW